MSPPRPAKRVLLIGWDAADWRIINPLIDAGKMPTLAAFVNEGVMGNLATLHPVLSPMLWTSIATGMRPYRHGILGFSEPMPDGRGVRPVSGLSRRVKALWNILSQCDFRSNVIAWWPTHPAEPIAGTMVSNHYARAVGPLERGWPMPPGTVHPPELAAALAECRLHPNELVAEDILPFVPGAAEIDQRKDRRLAAVAKILAECTSVHAAATWLMDETEWDFTAVYFDAIDHLCHGFMKYHPPRRDFVNERDFALYQGVVEAGYRYHDLMLRTLLEKAGDDTAVIIVSDHGFHPDHLRPESIPLEPAGPAVEHRDLGVIAMRGPGIRKDELLHGASLLDVTPTILALLGLPIGQDMDGRPLLAAFETPPEIALISSWEDVEGADGSHPSERLADPIADREALRQLVDLGYIDPPDEDAAVAAENAERELRFNLARSYMDGARHAQAVPVLQQLRERDPSELRFGIQLCMCYRALGEIPALRQLVDELIRQRRSDARDAAHELSELARERARDRAEGGDGARALSDAEQRRIAQLRQAAFLDEAALDFLLGFALSADEPQRALEHLRRAEAAKAHRPVLHVQIAETYLQMRRWDDAARSFARAAEIDPENPHAALGLCRSALGRRQNREAAEYAIRTVSLLHEYPMAHYCLGVALHRMGRVREAVEALEVAVAQNPNFCEAHERLAKLYRRRLRDPERATVHEEIAIAIRYGIGLEPEEEAKERAEEKFARSPRASTEPTARPVAEAADPEQVITVVSGLPRSGTSLMMQMLEAGGIAVLSDGERVADEDNPRGYYELERVKSLHEDASWLAEARGMAVKIIAQQLWHLPAGHAYRVIFMERSLEEVLASQARMLERRGTRGARLEHGELARTFERHLRGVKPRLAQRGIAACFVRYADVIADPRAVTQQIADFLERELDAEAMAEVVNPSLYRQRADAGDA